MILYAQEKGQHALSGITFKDSDVINIKYSGNRSLTKCSYSNHTIIRNVQHTGQSSIVFNLNLFNIRAATAHRMKSRKGRKAFSTFI